ncbi:MAG: hypothetical protein AAB491_00640 [Patescibacteria group bacterium]
MLFGYEAYKLLPFDKALTPQQAWDSVKKFLNPQQEKKDRDIFEDEKYDAHFRAYELVKDKYLFFLKILDKDSEIMNKYGKEIDEVELNARVSYAIHNCILKGEELVNKLDEIVGQFLSKRYKKEKDEKHKRDLADKETNPFLKKTMLCEIPDIQPSFSYCDCEITGVCMCVGKELPYMRNCLGNDLTSLMLGKKSHKKKMQEAARRTAEFMANLYVRR